MNYEAELIELGYQRALTLYADGELTRQEALTAGVTRAELKRIDQEKEEA